MWSSHRHGLPPPGVWSERRLACGLVVRSAAPHCGGARRVVLRLKYQSTPLPGAVVDATAAMIPSGVAALVPVPRVTARRWRYGVDPAIEIAAALRRRTGLAVLRLLRPRWWVPRRAGSAEQPRGRPTFGVDGVPGDGLLLVDDVLTTGATLCAARRVLAEAVVGAVTVTVSRSNAPEST